MHMEVCGLSPNLWPLEKSIYCERPTLKLETMSNVTNFKLCGEIRLCWKVVRRICPET